MYIVAHERNPSEAVTVRRITLQNVLVMRADYESSDCFWKACLVRAKRYTTPMSEGRVC